VPHSLRIAIVGASVRGTSLLERLLANATELTADAPLRVDVFDPHPPGSGRIWRAGQSPHLIMNTVAAQSTVFTDDSVTCAGPIRPGPSLAQWCRAVTADPDMVALPPDVAAEAARTTDASSPSRLLYGYYLRWCFERVVSSAPRHVDVEVHARRVEGIRRRDRGFVLTTDDGRERDADAVLLALGWLERSDTPPHPRVVAPGNPIDQDLSAIAPGSTVAVRGLGMGFFDTVSLLTEGRGGRFECGFECGLEGAADRAALVYRPSGAEPFIVAGSSRGVPYRAKPAFGAPPFFPRQRALRAWLAARSSAGRADEPVDFSRDVLPLIERDAHHDYSEALARVDPERVVDADTLLAALADPFGDSTSELLARHIPQPADRLDLDAAAFPLAAMTRSPSDAAADAGAAASADALVDALVRADAAEAALGADSPLKMGLHSYAAARGAVIDLVAFGGLSPDSFPAYRRYLTIAASFGSGPPLLRTRQLIALHDAGIVTFLGAGMRVDFPDATSAARLTVSGADVEPREVDALVEAWLPTPTVLASADPLVTALVASGLARVWRHADGSPSDALDIDPTDGTLISAGGDRVDGLHSVGVPHEDIRVFTIIAPVPGTDSSVLRETDAAARAALTHAAAGHPTRHIASLTREDS